MTRYATPETLSLLPYPVNAPERTWEPDYSHQHDGWYVRLHNGALNCANYTGHFGPFPSRAHAHHWLCEVLLAAPTTTTR